MDDLAESVKFISEKFDLITKRIDNLETKYTSVEKENKCLKAEVLRLSKCMDQHEEEINNMQQYSRRDCVEIAGLPQQMGENTNDLVIKVGALIGLSLSETDISVSHRLPQSTGKESYSSRLRPRDGAASSSLNAANQFPKVIVKFTRREVKEAFYNGRKHLRDKTTQDIGMGRSSNNRIYISESLSPRNKELFAKSPKFKKENMFKYIWTHSGRIYLRKNKDSPAYTITKLQDLDNLR